MADDFSTLFRCGITAAHSHFNIGNGQPHRLALLRNSLQWQFKILRHIGAKRFNGEIYSTLTLRFVFLREPFFTVLRSVWLSVAAVSP